MTGINVDRLAAVVDGCGGDDSVIARGVCIDSRAVKSGDVFFAIAGENFDGHEYVKQALDNGAVCAVCSRDVECGDERLIVRVDDTVIALGRLANFWRNEAEFKVVAITGSVGKTTCRQIVCHVLSKHFKCHQAEKSFNNNIGLPLTLLGADSDCEILIAEIGTNNPGEISELTAIAEPDIAVVNNIYPAHLEGLGSIEGIIAEKASIAEGLKPGGKLLINGDFAGLVDYCRVSGFDFVSFGTDTGCDIMGEKLISGGLRGSVSIDGVDVSVPLGGMGSLHNAVAAWAVCREFGISAGQFAEAVQTIPPLSMRMDVKEIGAVTVIDDCYNANPGSMGNAVEFLMSLAGEQKKRGVFICGEMAELGVDSDRLHTELGEVIAKARVGMVLLTGRQGERVAEAIRGLQHDAEVFTFAGTAELCENIINYVRTDDIILVKGSRSGRLERAVERIVEIFG